MTQKLQQIEEGYCDKSTISILNSSHLFQYGVAISASLSFAAVAVAFGWTSPTLPILLSEHSPLPITPDESSWIVVLMTVGALLAPLPSAWLMDRYGRKNALILAIFPLLISWILILIADKVFILYIARVLGGITFGILFSVLPLYLGEIAADSIRGSIGTLLTVMITFGVLYAYSIGPYVSFRLMAILAIIPIILFLVTFIWMPESPYFLLGANRKSEAINSLRKLNGGGGGGRCCNDNQIDLELKKIEENIEKSKEMIDGDGSIKELFGRAENRRCLWIIFGLCAAQHLCGSQSILAYSHKIFTAIDANGTFLFDASESSIILGVIQLIMVGLSTILIDRLGRRPLLLLSTILTAICNGIITIYFLLLRFGNTTAIELNWLPMLSVMFFIIFYSIGLATVPGAMIGEIFPKNIKAIGSAINTMFIAIISMIVQKLFQIVSDNWGEDFTFFGFTLFTIIFIGFIYWFVPETKGKTFNQIFDSIKRQTKN